MTRIDPFMTEALKDHVFKMYVEHPEVTIVVMRRPGMRNHEVQLTFTREGIAIQGDVGFGPNCHGICSAGGYGAEWFGDSKLSEHYLCSKFMAKAWHKEIAEEWVVYRLEELQKEVLEDNDEKEKRRIRMKIEGFQSMQSRGYEDEHEFYDELDEIGMYEREDSPGWGYDPNEAGWLCAVQRKFHELYMARLEALTKPIAVAAQPIADAFGLTGMPNVIVKEGE